MKYLKSFNESNQFITNPDEIKDMLLRITVYAHSPYNDNLINRITIHPDGVVDVRGGILIAQHDKSLKYRLPVKFGNVTGIFDIKSSSRLTTLEGCPEKCGHFNAYSLQSKNLVGGPKQVFGDYYIRECQITSLEGSPEIVGGDFTVSGSPIKNLEGGPRTVGGVMTCCECQLTDLVGSPDSVDKLSLFNLAHLTSLEGFPKVVRRTNINFSNPQINIWDPTPLKNCEFEQLVVDGYGGIPELAELFSPFEGKLRNVGGFLLNPVTKRFKESLDYNYVRRGHPKPQINLFRLREAFDELGGTPKFKVKKSKRMENYDFVDEEGRIVDWDGQVLSIK